MSEDSYTHWLFENTAADADPKLTFKVLVDDPSTGRYAQAQAEIAAQGFSHEVDLGITGPQMIHLFVDDYGAQRVHDADNQASLAQLRTMNAIVVAMRNLGPV